MPSISRLGLPYGNPVTKMAEDVEKYAYIHFVDKRDFKEVSVVGKHKSKKNHKADFGNMKGKLESSVR